MTVLKSPWRSCLSYYTRFGIKVVSSLILCGIASLTTAQESALPSDVLNSVEIVIDMESYVFSPSEISVEAGTSLTLILQNQSFLVPHNFLLDNPNGERILEADISSGESQTYVLTLPEPGIYAFYCDKQLLFFPTHQKQGMEGRFIVQ